MKRKSTPRKKLRRSLLHLILSVMVILLLVARLLRRDYHAVFLCVLTLLLFNVPLIIDRRFRVTVPRELEIVILLFIFAAEILGEIGSFYTYITWWDTMLHTVNGFLMAAIGFALVDFLNDHPKFHFSLSPVFVAFFAFCFSMTVGVVWEFFEFGMDVLTATDMQKDTILHAFSSVQLNPAGINDPVPLRDITETVIRHADGTTVIAGGYLDVGLYDTVKDMVVNCIGAVVFSVVGYFYLIGRSRGVFAAKFIPQLKEKEENDPPAEG